VTLDSKTAASLRFLGQLSGLWQIIVLRPLLLLTVVFAYRGSDGLDIGRIEVTRAACGV
jgi:hypothetical protein